MDKIQENLKEAIKHLQIAEHLVYVTYPLVNDKKLLLKIFEELYLSIINCIEAVKNYEKETDTISMEDFIKKYSKNYQLDDKQIGIILEVLRMKKRYNESAMEFVRKDKLVILSNNLGTKILDIQVIKSYFLTAKEFFFKISQKMK